MLKLYNLCNCAVLLSNYFYSFLIFYFFSLYVSHSPILLSFLKAILYPGLFVHLLKDSFSKSFLQFLRLCPERHLHRILFSLLQYPSCNHTLHITYLLPPVIFGQDKFSSISRISFSTLSLSVSLRISCLSPGYSFIVTSFMPRFL